MASKNALNLQRALENVLKRAVSALEEIPLPPARAMSLMQSHVPSSAPGSRPALTSPMTSSTTALMARSVSALPSAPLRRSRGARTAQPEWLVVWRLKVILWL